MQNFFIDVSLRFYYYLIACLSVIDGCEIIYTLISKFIYKMKKEAYASHFFLINMYFSVYYG